MFCICDQSACSEFVPSYLGWGGDNTVGVVDGDFIETSVSVGNLESDGDSGMDSKCEKHDSIPSN